MWNFSIPYKLKQYIDIIVQPKYLFRYTQDGGVEGLIKGKRMAVVASRGGDYTTVPMSAMDYQEPYLRAVFGFCGLTEIDFVVAQPMDASGREVQLSRLESARSGAEELGRGFFMPPAV
jgi:FMN-dependent NADH-azoreductase